MKAVMLSVQPKWCDLIAAGKKTIEARKTRPNLEVPFKVYIYCTQDKKVVFANHNNWRGNGMVIGEFICDRIRVENEVADQLVDVGLMRHSCLSSEELLRYADGKALYSWHISELKIYDEPKPLYDFYKPGALSEYDLDDNLCNYCVDTEHGKYRMVGSPDGPLMCEGRFCGAAYQEYLDEEFQITRPPQSWCYVEEA